MKLKTNLHLHTNDDPKDLWIDYSMYEIIDQAEKLGFDVLAITCHNKVVPVSEYEDYARKKGVLLISGIELTISGAHILVLNPPSKSVESVTSFQELRKYKNNHPEVFIIAPHPYHFLHALGSKTEKNIDLFDAIEHCWFYSTLINRNEKAEKLAIKHKKPFIATSDTHRIYELKESYAVIDAKEKTSEAIFNAIRENSFVNHTKPSNIIKMTWFTYLMAVNRLKRELATPTKDPKLNTETS